MVDRGSEYTVKEQIAAKIRKRIEEGAWRPRRRLPTVVDLADEYGVAKDTIQNALAILRDLGIVYTVKNRGTFVKWGADDVMVTSLAPGDRSIGRLATDVEREEMNLPPGSWVTVIERADGEVGVYPADKIEIRGSRGSD